MKWHTASLIAFFGSATLANPIKPTARDNGLDVYTLRISTKSLESLDGKYLGTYNSTIGVFKDAVAVQFYTTPGADKPGPVELHTYPIGIVDHVLALRGAGAQLDFVDVLNPGTTIGPSDDIYDWTSFSLSAEPEDPDKPPNCLEYVSDKEGRWVAIPDGNQDEWSVKWQGADGIYPDWYMPINIVYESVEFGD